MSSGKHPLFDDFYYRIVDREEFNATFRQYVDVVFPNTMRVDSTEVYSEQEKDALGRLQTAMDGLFVLYILVYEANELVGWHFGRQKDSTTYSMTNSAVFDAYRRKGVYRALLDEVLKIAQAQGFQKVMSRHSPHNNRVIIPKLQKGFVITGFEVTEQFGATVYLTYYFNEKLHKIMAFRSGPDYPDDDVKRYLGLE